MGDEECNRQTYEVTIMYIINSYQAYVYDICELLTCYNKMRQ